MLVQHIVTATDGLPRVNRARYRALMLLPKVGKQCRVLSQRVMAIHKLASSIGKVCILHHWVADRKGNVAVESLSLNGATEKIHVDRGRSHVTEGGLS